jgi:hypothetical protein
VYTLVLPKLWLISWWHEISYAERGEGVVFTAAGWSGAGTAAQVICTKKPAPAVLYWSTGPLSFESACGSVWPDNYFIGHKVIGWNPVLRDRFFTYDCRYTVNGTMTGNIVQSVTKQPDSEWQVTLGLGDEVVCIADFTL